MAGVLTRVDRALRRLDERYARYFTDEGIGPFLRSVIRALSTVVRVFPNPNIPETSGFGLADPMLGGGQGNASVFRHRKPDGRVWFETVIDGQFHELNATEEDAAIEEARQLRDRLVGRVDDPQPEGKQ